MIVVSLVNPPMSLRGDLSKWLQEINTNIYVGNVNARIREALWERITESIKTGQATMVYSTNNEQGMEFKVWGTNWEPSDLDGLILMKKPFPQKKALADKEESCNFKGYYKPSNSARASLLNPIQDERKLFAVVDLETTGLDPKKDTIIEIGIVICDEEDIYQKISFLVYDGTKVPQEIENLTGINEEILSTEGVPPLTALSKMQEIIGDKEVIFHNANFDLRFLMEAFKKEGLKPPLWKYKDTLHIAKRKIPGLKSYKLDSLCEFLNCPSVPSHRALSDCIACWEVYVKLLAKE